MGIVTWLKGIKLYTWVLLLFLGIAIGLWYWAYLDATSLPDFSGMFKKIGITVIKIFGGLFALFFGYKLAKFLIESDKAKSARRSADAEIRKADAQTEIAKALKKP